LFPGGYHSNIIFQFGSEGRGFRKWEPLVIYLYTWSDNRKRTDAVSKKHPTRVSKPTRPGTHPKLVMAQKEPNVESLAILEGSTIFSYFDI
jgi:hypothetical protein